MTFEQMRIFLEAAQFGSFTYAAERLGLTQSAVSVSIKKLEEKHDVLLFERSGRRLVLTEAGQLLLNEAERILRDVELTVERVRSRRPVEHTALVACTAHAYDFWMPELLAQTDKPPVEVTLLRGGVDQVTAWVMRGTADFGVTSVVPSHPQFQRIGVFIERMILCGSPERCRRLRDGLTWADLADQAPLLWEQHGELTPWISAALAAHRLDPSRLLNPSFKLSSSMAVISALKAGRCLGIVPERAVGPQLTSGQLVRVGPVEIPVRFWVFALRERDVDQLAAHLARVASETDLPKAIANTPDAD